MTYDPDRDPYNTTRSGFEEDGTNATALFIGALVVIALVFGGLYFYNTDQSARMASDMTINNTPIVRPVTPSPNPPAITPAVPSPAPNTQP